MEAIKEMGEYFKNLDADHILHDVFEDRTLQAQMIDLNQQQLYDQGVDAEGVPTGEYAKATIYGTVNFEGKIAKGQRYDHVTGKDSGASYATMKVKNEDDGAEIIGRFPDAFMRGWPDALGLTDGSIQEILPEVGDGIVEQLQNGIEK